MEFNGCQRVYGSLVGVSGYMEFSGCQWVYGSLVGVSGYMEFNGCQRVYENLVGVKNLGYGFSKVSISQNCELFVETRSIIKPLY